MSDLFGCSRRNCNCSRRIDRAVFGSSGRKRSMERVFCQYAVRTLCGSTIYLCQFPFCRTDPGIIYTGCPNHFGGNAVSAHRILYVSSDSDQHCDRHMASLQRACYASSGGQLCGSACQYLSELCADLRKAWSAGSRGGRCRVCNRDLPACEPASHGNRFLVESEKGSEKNDVFDPSGASDVWGVFRDDLSNPHQ